ncbi:hypothetical protein [Lentilactobacillus farraginis]|uniref:Uncharacterized protein n=1 Tax=Lentilactobacillus farraginis DSM 18382 = JCM 14108 TaxID=1423743 RepID=X0QBX5_9LACO|nr:hypothetical protein [Lentilactobacillus farraginis]GAF36105.1 hypothetical protein JCM14108_1050 [Lentilactobacillus farraginis DSM 18382 = JCM 14108]
MTLLLPIFAVIILVAVLVIPVDYWRTGHTKRARLFSLAGLIVLFGYTVYQADQLY